MSTTGGDPERYLEVSDVQEELPFNANDFPLQSSDQYDNALERALDAASGMVEDWTDTVFATTTRTSTLSRPVGVAERELPMPHRPVQSVTSVTVGGLVLDSEDYRAGETYLYLLPSAPISEWPTDNLAIDVTYTHGRDGVPSEVKRAIIRLVRNALDQIETDGMESDRTASESYTYRPPEDIKAECVAMVSGYSAPSYYGGAQVI
ncbi:hypothetical protein [Halococcus hamelinensis]|uniref:Uncharacterized protein n=1 Tax=Halococcus hamelinensis 100A6 TaxID=1132509 RepID=M0LZ85_9EURY|nr:hypothetical protein [Halococcus hamelinensis]EMA38468.1 hypothetical protein C447_09947 [Halococcus hamelinensis 100A6]